MATTTNYGWTTPNDTDLVKDGAAAIRTLGSSIDTTVFNNASAGIAKTIVDAKGDLIAATAADTVDRLAVGANDTVLTADSSTATGLKWAASGGAGANWTLVNAGGTSLLGGVNTVTISGITAADKLMIHFFNVSSASASSQFRIRFNADSGANYYYYGQLLKTPASYSTSYQSEVNSNNSSVVMAVNGTTHFPLVSGYVLVSGGNAAGDKMFNGSSGIYSDNATDGYGVNIGGRWNNSATVSSVSILSSVGNFDNGDIFVWKSA